MRKWLILCFISANSPSGVGGRFFARGVRFFELPGTRKGGWPLPPSCHYGGGELIGGVALRVRPVLPPLRWGEWPGSGCTVASEVAGVAWVSKEPRPKGKSLLLRSAVPTKPSTKISLPKHYQQLHLGKT